jgi:hypothetical protein
MGANLIEVLRSRLGIADLVPDDIEAAHTVPSHTTTAVNRPEAGPASDQQQPLSQMEPAVVVRFMSRSQRDLVIRQRKSLKGTRVTISEDLTALNIRTLNRLRNHEHVQKCWSWNGRLFAILSNGRQVVVRPFQPVTDLL